MKRNAVLEKLQQKQLKKDIPDFRVGDTVKVHTRIVEGKGAPEDLDKLDDVASKIEGRTICALGDAAAMPVRSFIKDFRSEFEHYIETGKSVLDAADESAAA